MGAGAADPGALEARPGGRDQPDGHRLPGARDFLLRSPWPEADQRLVDPSAEAWMGRVVALVQQVRWARKAAGAPDRGGRLRPDRPMEPAAAALVAQLAAVEVTDELAGPGVVLAEAAARIEFPTAELGAAAGQAAAARLRRELQRSRAKLANRQFLARAQTDVVERERARLAELEEALGRLDGGRSPS